MTVVLMTIRLRAGRVAKASCPLLLLRGDCMPLLTKCTAPRLAVKVIHTSRAGIKSSDTVCSVRDALPSTGQTCGKEVASSATAPRATLRAALSKDSSTSVILS